MREKDSIEPWELQGKHLRESRESMDDRKLDVLITTIEMGSFSKAARRCCCTQSAITQLMNAIEAELGCKVVERSHSGVHPTEAGKQLLPIAREARGALAKLATTAANVAGTSMHLRIGVYASIAQTWFPAAMAAFKQQEPDSSFETRIGSKDLGGLLRNGSIDLAVCDDWLFESELAGSYRREYRDPTCIPRKQEYSWAPLMEDAFFAVVPSSLGYTTGQVISRDELFDHPYVFDTQYVYAQYLTSHVTSLVKVSSDDNATVLSMVASDMGVSVLPELSLQHVPAGVAVLQMDPPGKRTLGIALPPDAIPLALKFARHLQATLAE